MIAQANASLICPRKSPIQVVMKVREYTLCSSVGLRYLLAVFRVFTHRKAPPIPFHQLCRMFLLYRQKLTFTRACGVPHLRRRARPASAVDTPE